MLKVFNQNWLNPNQQCAVLVKQMVDMLKNDEDLEIPRAECIYVGTCELGEQDGL